MRARRPDNVADLLPDGLAEVRYHEVRTQVMSLSIDGARVIATSEDVRRSAGYAIRQWTGNVCRWWHRPEDADALVTEHSWPAGPPVLPSSVATFVGPPVERGHWRGAVDSLRCGAVDSLRCGAVDSLRRDAVGALGRQASSRAVDGIRQTIVLRWSAVHTDLCNTAGALVRQSTNLVSLETSTHRGGRVAVHTRIGDHAGDVAAWYREHAGAGLAAVSIDAGFPAAIPTRLVADEDFAGLLAHEVVGHAMEGDVAGGLPATHWSRGGRPVAGPHVTIVDDPRAHPLGPWDHEGVLARPVTLLDEGRVGGRLHSLRSATDTQAAPTGHARAVSWHHQPIPRMMTTGFVGTGTVAELALRAGPEVLDVYGARGGRALADGSFWAVSQGARLSRNGRRTEIGPVLVSGSSAALLASIRAVSTPGGIVGGGEGGCGKAGQFPWDAATRSGALLLDLAAPDVSLVPLWTDPPRDTAGRVRTRCASGTPPTNS